MASSATSRVNIASGSPYEDVFGYCRAVRVRDHVHVAGTCAPAGNETASTYEQSKAALAVIGAALQKVGCGFSDVVRTVVYVKDIAEADQVARAHSEIFAAIKPAATMVQVSAMLLPWHRVEIEAYAVAPSA